MRDALFPDAEVLASLCRKHHIRRLSVFGSTLKGTARSDSDLDLLVEFEPHAKPGLIGHGDDRIRAIVSPERAERSDLRTAARSQPSLPR